MLCLVEQLQEEEDDRSEVQEEVVAIADEVVAVVEASKEDTNDVINFLYQIAHRCL